MHLCAVVFLCCNQKHLFLKTLQSGYTPPSCKLLAGSLLETEVAKVNRKIERESLTRENLHWVSNDLLYDMLVIHHSTNLFYSTRQIVRSK